MHIYLIFGFIALVGGTSDAPVYQIDLNAPAEERW